MTAIRSDRKQPTPMELRDDLLRFIRQKFYLDHQDKFFKDQPRILKWVVLELAVFLDRRAVTISAERYREIMIGEKGILMEALRFGNTSKIGYLPAWLRHVVQTHLQIHGEDYYDEGKSIRTATENALALARGGLHGREVDVVRELAAAARLLRPKRKAVKVSRNDQLTML